MADDRGTTPTPRPRRRRTDIDPKAPSPSVEYERRRRRGAPANSNVPTAGPGATDDWASVAARLVEHATPIDVGGSEDDATAQFHVPGVAAAALAAPPSVPDRPREEVDPGRAWLARLDDRSLDPNVCPFLRAAADGTLITPLERPDPANRCAALSEAVPQSLRQQELVCLSSGHVNCPRYLRGAAFASETPTPVVRAGRTLTTPVFASLIVLVMAVSASVAFALTRGGLVLEGAGPSPSLVAVVPSPTALAVEPTTEVTPVAPSVDPGPVVTPGSTPTFTPSATPTSTPKPTPGSKPTSDRYKLLKPCPNTPKCWIYTVRSGDNLVSIAHYFGVSRDSIYARNSWLKQSGLRSGQQLRLPPPTR